MNTSAPAAAGNPSKSGKSDKSDNPGNPASPHFYSNPHIVEHRCLICKRSIMDAQFNIARDRTTTDVTATIAQGLTISDAPRTYSKDPYVGHDNFLLCAKCYDLLRA